MRKPFTMRSLFMAALLLLTSSQLIFARTPLAGVDAGIMSIAEPTAPGCAGSQTVKAVIHNYGSVNITSVLVGWTVNGVTQTPYNFNGIILSGADDTVNLGTVNFSYGDYTLQAFTYNPNNGPDDDASNDSSSVTITSQMSGTYTIGGTTPDFAKFNDALTAMTTYGLCGSVIFNMRAGSDTMQAVIGEIPGADSLNTILFQAENGDSTSVTLTYPSQPALTSTNYLIKMNGADYITFKHLTLERSGIQPYGRVIEFTSNATHNTITNCRLNGSTNATNNSLAALVYSSSSTTFNDSMNTFTYNHFINGSIGVYMNGVNTIQLELGTVINNNNFDNQYSKAIQMSNEGAATIQNNLVTTSSGNIAYVSIYLDRCQRNHVITANNMTSVSGTGIYLVDCTGLAGIHGLIANNFIHCTDSAGISVINGDYQDIVFNSVLVTGVNTNYSALFMRGNGTGKNIKNNILANTGGGYAYVVSDSAVFGISASDHNNLFTTGTNIGDYDGTIATSLNSWIAASHRDSNSVAVNPNYVSSTDLHATAIAMDDRGVPFAPVTTDIDGQSRSNLTPDIGADEYASVSRNVGVTALLSLTDSTCGDSAAVITVVVSNTGGFTESGFNVTTILSGMVSDTITAAIPGTLASGSSDTITYVGTYDLSAGGSLTVKSFTDLSVDDVHANDTLNATYFFATPPAAPTASDVTNCGPGSVTLSATSADSTILWYAVATGGTPLDTGATYTTAVLNASATYYVSAYGLCESDRTPVNVSIFANPVVNLGADTSVNLGNTVTIDAGAGFNTYLWSTAATTQSITVNSGGCYTVTVSDANGCTGSDTRCVNIILPFDVGVTEILSPLDHDCADDSVYVQIRLSNLGSSAASTIPLTVDITGSTTTTFTQTIAGPISGTSSVVLNMGVINSVSGGTYHLIAYTGYSNDQDHTNDTTVADVTIVVAPPAPVGLGGARCGAGPVIINASSTDTIYWYDAPAGGNLLYVGDSYSIPNLTTTTTFYAQTGNYCNTQTRTAIVATVWPLPNVNLGPDAIASDSLVLDAGAGFVQYVWNTSETTQTIVADSSGQYIVAVLDNNGCINSDTINVTITVGMADLEIDGITIYPNPASNQIFVQSSNANKFDIRMIDGQGRILYNATSVQSRSSLNLSTYAEGIYTLQIISGDKVSTRMVVIHR